MTGAGHRRSQHLRPASLRSPTAGGLADKFEPTDMERLAESGYLEHEGIRLLG